MGKQCYHVIRMQLRRPESTQNDFQKDTIHDPGPRQLLIYIVEILKNNV
jgi:hypothetical protein